MGLLLNSVINATSPSRTGNRRTIDVPRQGDGRSKSYYAREAIRQYQEDRDDYSIGIAVLERGESTITLDELERRLGHHRSGPAN
jgi:hypothetical protein